jgi:DNA helicase-2/ATP-dependent DNA helicase PcrA
MSDHVPLAGGFGSAPVQKPEPSGSTLGQGFAAKMGADLSGLNPQQREAAEAPADGTELIIAGAGCGKTKTILKRAEHLYFEHPGTIGVISFARSVKDELEERIHNTTNPLVAANIKVMTNHAVGNRLVMNNLGALGLPKGTEIVSQEWKITKLMKDRMEVEAGLSPDKRAPHYSPIFNRYTDSQIKALFRAEEKLSAEGIDIAARFQGRTSGAGSVQFDEVIKVFKSFKVLKELDPQYMAQFVLWARIVRMVEGKLMFRDLLPLAALLPVEAYKIFRFQHVLVDEAQDLSVDQHTVVQKLASVVTSMTFVGDPGQCIYRFSGARPDLFLTIPERYPGTQTRFLEVNYRSTEPILDLANHLLENHLGAPLRLLPNGEQRGEPIEHFDGTRENLLKWLEALTNSGVNTQDIAILFRSNVNALDVEVALSSAGIRYNCWSGSFFEHAVVEDMLAYFRLLTSKFPVYEDWERVVTHVKFLGKKTAEDSWASAKNDPTRAATPASCRSGFQQKRFGELLRFLSGLRNQMKYADSTTQNPNTPLSDYVNHLRTYLNGVWEERWPDDPEKLREAGEVADAFVQWINGRAPSDVLDAIENTITQDPGGVVLSTVHKFKGLEREYVGLWSVGVGAFPKNWDSTDHEEEMCIFYVAATRAKKRLTIFQGKKVRKDGTIEPMTLPYGLDKMFCTKGLLFARHGTQTACDLCEHQIVCLTNKRR